jgi:hypothetical protein
MDTVVVHYGHVVLVCVKVVIVLHKQNLVLQAVDGVVKPFERLLVSRELLLYTVLLGTKSVVALDRLGLAILVTDFCPQSLKHACHEACYPSRLSGPAP